MISVLSGGVGAARLLRILTSVVKPEDLRAIVNVGDDLVLHGLTICPDLDTIMYTLAQLNNDELGWGLRGETWRVMAELEQLHGESWFRLGDRDLATHLYRSQRISEGATKTEVTRELCAALGVDVALLPVTNDAIATTFDTEVGRLSFQRYFVQHHHDVVVHAIDIEGAQDASPTPEVLHALETSTRIIIAPSNPLISIAPILAVPGVRELLQKRRGDVVAVSPIIGGAAVKGPADRLLRELGHESSCVSVAEFYHDYVGTFVIDSVDAGSEELIASTGMAVRVVNTIMSEPANWPAIARSVLA